MFKLRDLKQIFKSPVVWFFVALFICGICTFQDYGIGWDDEWSRTATGHSNYNYIFHNDKGLLTNHEKYHGPFVELILVVAEKISGFEDTQSIYHLRHLILFLLFFGALIAFFKISSQLFGYWFGIMGCLMLVFSPRMFAESFFNSKDLAFLSLFTIGVWSYIRFVKNPTIKWALIHAFICGMIIDTRVMGILIPMISIFYVLIFNIKNKFQKSHLISLAVFVLTTIGAVILFWPILWEGPYHHFTSAFQQMKNYPWSGHVFFNNHPVHSTALPWNYIPVWISITSPVFNVFFILLGLLIFTRRVIINHYNIIFQEPEMVSFYFLSMAPVVAVIFFKSVIYDSWRHVFFIYPMLLLFALYGMNMLFSKIRQVKYLKEFIIMLFCINILYTGYWMVKNHPLQNIYFNKFSRHFFDVGRKFELDYWGLSYKQGLEYILQHANKTDTIIYSALNLPGQNNLMIMSKEDRQRMKYVDANDPTWQYYLTNYRGGSDPENSVLWHKIMVDSIPVLGIYIKKPINNE